jgi:kinetochore protein Nuf2
MCVCQTQLKVDVATLKENIGKLKSQIVESPEEMKIQMEKMKENVKNIKLAIEMADERLVGLQSNVQGVTHSEADIQLIFKLLQDLQSSMNKTQQHQEEVSTVVVVRPNSTRKRLVLLLLDPTAPGRG